MGGRCVVVRAVAVAGWLVVGVVGYVACLVGLSCG